MTWTSKTKAIGISSLVSHHSASIGVIGRAPAISSINFSALELFGAAARCSHLHLVNPKIITPESQMLAKLIEPHVDNLSNDFAFLGTVSRFKDFVKSYFIGSVAAGIAYLEMVSDLYTWSDHFENVSGGHPTHKKKPDFVFLGNGIGVALVDAKGSRRGTPKSFSPEVSKGYVQQVEPHLGHMIGGALATHGFCIGAWLGSTTKAELCIHHTAVPVSPQVTGFGPMGSGINVQRNNFATAFALAHSPQLGQWLRGGISRPDVIPFWRFPWLGRNWVTGFGLRPGRRYHPRSWQHWPYDLKVCDAFHYNRVFALEESQAEAALLKFLGDDRTEMADAPELTRLDDGLRMAARRGEGGDWKGAIFPDGLAVLDFSGQEPRFEPILWDMDRPGFRTP